jgi:hypothetical protein
VTIKYFSFLLLSAVWCSYSFVAGRLAALFVSSPNQQFSSFFRLQPTPTSPPLTDIINHKSYKHQSRPASQLATSETGWIKSFSLERRTDSQQLTLFVLSFLEFYFCFCLLVRADKMIKGVLFW